MPAGNDFCNNQILNVVVHNVDPLIVDGDGRKILRGLPGLGKITYEHGTVYVCVSLDPDPSLDGGGTWVPLGGETVGGCPSCLHGVPDIGVTGNDLNATLTNDFNLDIGNDFNVPIGNDFTVQADRDVNVLGRRNLNLSGPYGVSLYAHGDQYVQIGDSHSDVLVSPKVKTGALGSYVGAWPIYDGNNNTIGWVPYYDAVGATGIGDAWTPPGGTWAPTPPSGGVGGVPGGSVPSGTPMPTGDLTGWHQVFAEDFGTNDSIGDWGPGITDVPSPYTSKFRLYADRTPDTSAQVYGTDSGYYPSDVLNVNTSVLRWYVHRDGATAKAAAVLPVFGASNGNQLYGSYSFRMRSAAVTGFKVAWLLWPQSEVWPRDGEIDFPEGALGGSVDAFMHRQGGVDGGDQDYFSSGVTMSSWHTYTIEWLPASCKFFVDGSLIGTVTSRVPNTPMHFILQTEREIGGAGPGLSDNGLVELDWIVIYAPV